MALKRNERYPGRFENPTTEQPQGAFKNRTSPTAEDGSYFEADWANDWSGFFERLLTLADITPDGSVDTALDSQYYDALQKLTLQRDDPFGDIKLDGTMTLGLQNLGLGGMGQTYSASQENPSTTMLTASFTMTPPSNGVLFVNAQFLINKYTTEASWTPSATGGTVKNVTGQYNNVGSGAFAVSVTKGMSVTVSSRITQETTGAMKSSMTAIFVPTVG